MAAVLMPERPLIERGYRILSHAVGHIVPRVLADGKVYFLVLEYYKRRGRISMRQVVETGLTLEKESVGDTLIRAIDDEFSAEKGSASVLLLSEEPVYTVFKQDEVDPSGIHLLSFFFTSVEGDLRQVPKMDGEEELGPVRWFEARHIIEDQMEKNGTVPVHLEATRAALATLAEEHEKVYMTYSRLLGRCKKQELTDAEKAAIRSYDRWFK